MYRVLFLLCLLTISANSFSHTSLSLEQAISIGLNNSMELSSQEIQILLGKQSRTLSLREWFPGISLNYTSNDSVTQNSADSYNKNISMKVSQLVYDGGATAYSHKMLGKQLEIEQENLVKARFKLRSKIWSEYHKISLLESQLDLKKESLINAKSELSVIELKTKHGSLTKLDMLEAQISMKKLELEIDTLLSKLDEGLFQFKTLLNLPIDTEIALKKIKFHDYLGFQLPWNITEFKEICLRSSTEYKSAKLEIEKQRIQLKLSKLNFIPTLKLNGTVGFSGNDFPLTDPTYTLAVEVAFNNKSFPTTGNLSIGKSGEHTLNRGSTIGVEPFKDLSGPITKKKAEVALENAVYKLKKLNELIPFQAERSYKLYNQSKEELLLESELLELEDKKMNILNMKFQLGEIEYSKLLTARNNYSQSEMSYLEKILALLEQEKQLAFLMGLAPDQLNDLRGELDHED